MIKIYGAGFSGLTLAYYFIKSGVPVEVYEKTDRAGGLLSTEVVNGIPIESAANGFLCSEKLEQLCQDIEIELITTKKEARKRFIFRDGLKRWPLTIKESIELLARIIFSKIRSTWHPNAQQTASEWAKINLGVAGHDYLFQPMINGIYANDLQNLSAKRILKSLFWPKRKGIVRGLVSTRNGMGFFIQELHRFLQDRGVKFHFKSEDKNISDKMNHNTFLAISAYDLKNQIKTNLKNSHFLSSRSLLKVTIQIDSASEKINGFGVLFPNVERFNSLGVLINSVIFENRGDYNESWIFSDGSWNKNIPLDVQDIKKKILEDRQRLFPNSKNITILSYHFWNQAIPDYNQALDDFLTENKDAMESITGNYCGVIGLSGILERNHSLVKNWKKKYKHD